MARTPTCACCRYRKLDPTGVQPRIGRCFLVWGFFGKEFQGGGRLTPRQARAATAANHAPLASPWAGELGAPERRVPPYPHPVSEISPGPALQFVPAPTCEPSPPRTRACRCSAGRERTRSALVAQVRGGKRRTDARLGFGRAALILSLSERSPLVLRVPANPARKALVGTLLETRPCAGNPARFFYGGDRAVGQARQ